MDVPLSAHDAESKLLQFARRYASTFIRSFVRIGRANVKRFGAFKSMVFLQENFYLFILKHFLQNVEKLT